MNHNSCSGFAKSAPGNRFIYKKEIWPVPDIFTVHFSLQIILAMQVCLKKQLQWTQVSFSQCSFNHQTSAFRYSVHTAALLKLGNKNIVKCLPFFVGNEFKFSVHWKTFNKLNIWWLQETRNVTLFLLPCAFLPQHIFVDDKKGIERRSIVFVLLFLCE